MRQRLRQRKRPRRKSANPVRERQRGDQPATTAVRGAAERIMRRARVGDAAPAIDTGATPRNAAFDNDGTLTVTRQKAPRRPTDGTEQPSPRDIGRINAVMRNWRGAGIPHQVTRDSTTGTWDRSPDTLIKQFIAARSARRGLSYINLTVAQSGVSVTLMLSTIAPGRPRLIWLGDLGGHRGQDVLGRLEPILSKLAEVAAKKRPLSPGFTVTLALLKPARGFAIRLAPG